MRAQIAAPASHHQREAEEHVRESLAAPSDAPLVSHPLTPTERTHALATLAMWMLVPLLIGWWHLARRNVGWSRRPDAGLHP